MLTKHAQSRIQQRGMSLQIIEDLLLAGCETYSKGASLYHGTDFCVRLLIAEGRKRSSAEAVRGKYIVCREGTVITAGTRFRRIRR
jgi:hypothetical protein